MVHCLVVNFSSFAVMKKMNEWWKKKMNEWMMKKKKGTTNSGNCTQFVAGSESCKSSWIVANGKWLAWISWPQLALA